MRATGRLFVGRGRGRTVASNIKNQGDVKPTEQMNESNSKGVGKQEAIKVPDACPTTKAKSGTGHSKQLSNPINLRTNTLLG